MQHISMWTERWFLSCNAKDIGILYLIFALFSGLVGTAFSVLIRLELAGPGVQYIADNQLYNSIITAHAILMIFFMVNKQIFMLNSDATSYDFQASSRAVAIAQSDVTIDNKGPHDNNDDNNSDCPLDLVPSRASTVHRPEDKGGIEKGGGSKYKYTRIIVQDPYNNRHILLKVTKNQKGIYVWETLDRKNLYVGHSINLYNRISSYFMPSILKSKARRVLKYFNKHGFSDIKLTIYIMETSASLEQVVELEQHFIDGLKPNLNVDLVASSSGYHEPMSQEIRERLRKQRGINVFMYNAEDLTLLHIFDSKQHMYDTINIHHKTLNDCLSSGAIYLDTFFLSLDPIEESTNTNLLSLDELNLKVKDKRNIYRMKHPAAKAILAEFKGDSSKNLEFNSLSSLAKHLKGDRQVIRDYLKGTKSGYYRGKWKFTYQFHTQSALEAQ
jgi:hypothetical protein